MITAIWKDQHLQRVELQPLSLAETSRLVEQVLDGPVESLSARRLWQYTQGNVLYLYHLLASEVDAGRVTQRAGVWIWVGNPTLSATLAELVDARVANAPEPVRGVLGALAVAEPLETDVLAADAADRERTVGAARVGGLPAADLPRSSVTTAPPIGWPN